MSEIYIDALYYNENIYSTECRNTAATVDRGLENLNSNSSKLVYLTEKISMRVIGLVWEDLSTLCSTNRKYFNQDEVASHLKIMVSKQWSRSIPTNPSVLIPAR